MLVGSLKKCIRPAIGKVFLQCYYKLLKIQNIVIVF